MANWRFGGDVQLPRSGVEIPLLAQRLSAKRSVKTKGDAMRIPGFGKNKIDEPIITVTPLQELLIAENEVKLAQGRIHSLNKEFWDWKHHYQVIEDDLGQFVGVMNESALSGQLSELQINQQFNEFNSRKSVLLFEFHQRLAAWADLKQRHSQVVQQTSALPMLAPSV
jgi:hypothetical protein